MKFNINDGRHEPMVDVELRQDGDSVSLCVSHGPGSPPVYPIATIQANGNVIINRIPIKELERMGFTVEAVTNTSGRVRVHYE